MTENAVHPGAHLAEFVEEYEITRYQLAKALHVQQTRIDEIVKGRRAITADTAVRLGRYFNTSPEFWMNLQAQYDIAQAEKAVTEPISRIA